MPVGKRPRGVTTSPEGRRVYVANSNSDTVTVLDARSLAVIRSGPAGIDPEGLVVDHDGVVLYVVNENELSVTILAAVGHRGRRRAVTIAGLDSAGGLDDSAGRVAAATYARLSA